MRAHMAHRRSSIKKIRVDERRREHNLRVKSELKTVRKKAMAGLASKKAPQAKASASEFFSAIDKAVKKGVVHPNRAARLKSRLARKVSALKAAA